MGKGCWMRSVFRQQARVLLRQQLINLPTNWFCHLSVQELDDISLSIDEIRQRASQLRSEAKKESLMEVGGLTKQLLRHSCAARRVLMLPAWVMGACTCVYLTPLALPCGSCLWGFGRL